MSAGIRNPKFFPKFHHLIIVFYFFSIFDILFSIPHIYTYPKKV